MLLVLLWGWVFLQGKSKSGHRSSQPILLPRRPSGAAEDERVPCSPTAQISSETPVPWNRRKAASAAVSGDVSAATRTPQFDQNKAPLPVCQASSPGSPGGTAPPGAPPATRVKHLLSPPPLPPHAPPLPSPSWATPTPQTTGCHILDAR